MSIKIFNKYTPTLGIPPKYIQTLDFENGVLGTTVEPSYFIRSGNFSWFSNTQVNSGNQSVECSVRQGRSGEFSWGGDVDFDNISSGEGDEIYVKFSIFIPSTFKVQTFGAQMMKFHRFYAKTPRTGDSSSRGNDIGILNEDRSDSLGFWVTTDEIVQDMYPGGAYVAGGNDSSDRIIKDTWNTFVFGYELRSDLTGRIRFWKETSPGVWNNFSNITNIQTLAYPDDVWVKSKILSYFNGGSNAPDAVDLYIGSKLYTDFTDGNIVKGSTSLLQGTVNSSLGRFQDGQNRLSVDGLDNTRDAPQWTIGETLTEYSPDGITATGQTAILEAMYPEKNQKLFLDDISYYNYLPPELI